MPGPVVAPWSRLHLTAAERALVLRLLVAHLGPAGLRGVHVFGSRVEGWPGGRGLKRHSDLDLALAGEPGDRTMALLRADLEDSDLPWRVDLCRLGDLPEGLREQVRRCGVVLG